MNRWLLFLALAINFYAAVAAFQLQVVPSSSYFNRLIFPYDKATALLRSPDVGRSQRYPYSTKEYSVTTRLLLSSSDAASAKVDSNKEKEIIFISKEKDQELLERGEHEAKLMRNNQSVLKANKAKGVGASGGFGGSGNDGAGGGGSPSKRLDLQAKAHAKVLRKEGVVRFDNVLTSSLADALKEYVVDLRARATEDVRNGKFQLGDRFADKLHNQNRCDLMLPLGPRPVNEAVYHILTKTPVRSMIEQCFAIDSDGSDATLYELNCFMSNSGSRRQLVHPDAACERSAALTKEEATVLTCFVALQDVDATMGPTCWIPRSHNEEAHDEFFSTALVDGSSETSKERFLRTRKNALGILPKGACVVFDPRTLHCATANTCPDPSITRALFYLSFKNPRVADPGCPSTSGYGIANAEITIKELADGLEALLDSARSSNKSVAIKRLEPIMFEP